MFDLLFFKGGASQCWSVKSPCNCYHFRDAGFDSIVLCAVLLSQVVDIVHVEPELVVVLNVDRETARNLIKLLIKARGKSG